jgi:hypothetical protein
LSASSRLPVIERAFGDVSAEHLFQTQGLSAELDFVASIPLGTAALILHWERTPQPVQIRKGNAVQGAMKLHYIGLAGQSEAQ